VVINGRLRLFSITSFFCLNYFVWALFGSILLNCVYLIEEDNKGFYSHPDILFNVWLYTLLGYFFLFVGFTLAHAVWGKRKLTKFISQKPVEVSPYDLSSRNYRWIVFLFIVAVIVLLLYRSIIGAFPLESVFLGLSGHDLALLRSDATNNFSGKMYRFTMFMEVLPLYLFIILSFIKKGKIEKKWRILFIFLLLYNIFYTLITLQKAPIINFMILCYIIYTYKKGEMSKKPLIIMSVFGSFLIIIMYIFFMGVSEDMPISLIVRGALHRVFISSIDPFFYYIKYTNEHGLLWGTSFPNPGGIFPFEHFRLTVEIMEYSRDTASDVVGSQPTVFLGEMYANFGFFAIIISSVFMGFLLQTLDFIFWAKLSKKKNVLNCALYIELMIFFSQYAQTGFSGIVVDTTLYFIVFISIWYLQRQKKYNSVYFKRKVNSILQN